MAIRLDRRSEEEKELHAKGWRTLSDAAYLIAYRTKRNAAGLDNDLPKIFSELAANDSAEYTAANVRKFYRRTYVSPDVIERLTALVRTLKKKRG